MSESGGGCSEAVKFVEGVTDPDWWGDAMTTSITCSEHSYHTPSVSAPGGDVAEFAMAMRMYEDLLAKKLNDDGFVAADADTTTMVI